MRGLVVFIVAILAMGLLIQAQMMAPTPGSFGNAAALWLPAAKRNLLTNPLDLSASTWTKSNVTVSRVAGAGPVIGGVAVDAWRLTESSATGYHYALQAPATTPQYLLSVYAKASERGWLLLYDDAVGYGRYFNLNTGVTGGTLAGAPAASGISAVGGGWYRCWILVDYGSSHAASFRIASATGDGAASYTGDGTSSLLIAAPQLERVWGPNLTQAYPSAFEDSGTGGFVTNMLPQPKLMLGPELVSNGTFDADTGFAKDAGVTIHDGAAFWANSSGCAIQNIHAVFGHAYRTAIGVVSYTSGDVYAVVGGNDASPHHGALGLFSDWVLFKTYSSDNSLYVCGTAFTGSIDNVSVREVQNYPLLLGGAPNASTANWPTWETDANGKGVKMATSQYLLSPVIPALNMAGDWSVMLVGKFDGTSGTIVSLADPASANKWQIFQYTGAGTFDISSYDGSAEATSANLTVPTAEYVPLLFTNHSGLTLSRLDTATAVTAASRAPSGVPRLGFGALSKSTVSNIVGSAHLAAALLWPTRALGTAEASRHCRELQTLLAQPNQGGVQIACQ